MSPAKHLPTKLKLLDTIVSQDQNNWLTPGKKTDVKRQNRFAKAYLQAPAYSSLNSKSPVKLLRPSNKVNNSFSEISESENLKSFLRDQSIPGSAMLGSTKEINDSTSFGQRSVLRIESTRQSSNQSALLFGEKQITSSRDRGKA